MKFIGENAKDVLKKVWGYDEFRYPQDAIVQSIVRGIDTVALLPTGGGKSICYQLPSLLVDGKVVVVSPLISLMMDQVKSLSERGIMAKALHSGLTSTEVDLILDNFVHGPLKLLYISPERIDSELFQVRFQRANVAFIAVDEAHCISQWGHDFRPSYLKISMLREIKPNVPLIALTATATSKIIQDISDQLFLRKPNVFSISFARKNISFNILSCDDKENELLRILDQVQGSTIIYLRSRKGCVKLATFLTSKKIFATSYHAGMNYEAREHNQQLWMANKVRVMVATNAFGMGIDKKDVRCVIHLDIPSCLEDYYQEAGRAGRDNNQSYAISLINNSDVLSLTKVFDYSFPSEEEIKSIYILICKYLHIGFGTGFESSFYFDAEDFCETFKVNRYKVASVIKILGKQGWWSFAENNFVSPKIQIITDSYQIDRHYDDSDVRGIVLLEMLRMYENLFIELCDISINKISQRTNIDPPRIVFILNVLKAEGVIDFVNPQHLPELTFLTSRPHDDEFNIDKKVYEASKKQAEFRLNSIIEFYLGKSCRQQYLLQYFDEDAEVCGMCDICKGSNKIDYSIEEKRIVYKQIFHSNETHLTVRKVLLQWPSNKRKRIEKCIQDLEIEKYIKIEKNSEIFRLNKK